MSISLVLDSGILGRLCHPRREISAPPTTWLADFLTSDGGREVYLPEIADYELRRKLLHLAATGRSSTRAIDRLDQLRVTFVYLPLTTAVMRHAAELWADARTRGSPTAPDTALDGDIILAAQALAVGGTVITTNTRHLSRFVAAKTWEELAGE
jgi:predicted nucleic acid-binding protein